MHRTIPVCGRYRGLKWSYITGSQVLVLWWHTSHERAVTKCAAGFRVAPVPLPAWQSAQCPGPTPACANVAGFQAVVRWHASHNSVVGKWLLGFAVALPPGRWQLAQLPGRTPACEKGPLPGNGNGLVPAVARGFVGPKADGLPVGRTGTPVVGRGLALAAAAAAAAKPPVGLWQSTQSAVAVLFSCAPSVLVP
jgi:hypothetical protein